MDRTNALNMARKYTSVIKNNYDCKQVFLFGSYAKGTNHEEGDIDIAVILSEFENLLEIQLELMRLRRKIDSRIESSSQQSCGEFDPKRLKNQINTRIPIDFYC